MPSFYAVVMGDEDGRSFHSVRDVNELLADPQSEMGITRWEDAAYLKENPDPNYWPEGIGVLIEYEVIRPRPAGAYVLPPRDE